MVKKIACVILLCLLISPAESAFAWSEGGHHIIALMAYKLLSTSEQAKLQAILTKHPRFAEDFAPPKDLPNPEEIDHWRIGRAGYWPDIARRQPAYHRATWHYELGAALSIGDEKAIAIPKRPGPLPTEATLETQELYISQALELCKNVLADESKPDHERALALCWIAHLVAYAHQPCHAGSLYMEKVFAEEDGDRGANRILTKQRGNLHALWDQLLGNQFSLRGTRSRIVEITSEEALVVKGKQAIESEDGLDPQKWLSESRKLATESVYTTEVLDSLHLVSRGLIEKPEPIELSGAYLKSAGRVAQVRAVEAAHRLAETWRGTIR
jgi:hypothetical protein